MPRGKRTTTPSKPKVRVITDEELPKCEVCDEVDGKKVNAEYLAYIGIRVGSQEWQDWTLVCEKHRHRYLAFRLVKVVDNA